MTQWNKYGPTAARQHGRPGRGARPRSITIDVHSHVGVPRAADLVRPHLDPAAMPLVAFADAGTRALNQQQEADIVARAGLDQRLADLDAMGLDMQIVKPPPPQCYYAVPLDIAVEAARVVNDGIAEFVSRCPDRLERFEPLPDAPAAALGPRLIDQRQEQLVLGVRERSLSVGQGDILLFCLVDGDRLRVRGAEHAPGRANDAAHEREQH